MLVETMANEGPGELGVASFVVRDLVEDLAHHGVLAKVAGGRSFEGGDRFADAAFEDGGDEDMFEAGVLESVVSLQWAWAHGTSAVGAGEGEGHPGVLGFVLESAA